MVVLQLDPTIPLDSPRGPCFAHFLIDMGQEHNLLFVCFINKTGECWTFEARHIRMARNETMGIRSEQLVGGEK